MTSTLDEAPATEQTTDEPTSWGDPSAVAPRKLRFFWFAVGGAKFTHLDITGREALALEEQFGIPWGQMQPAGLLPHRMAYLTTFLARTDPEHARERVEAMTLAELAAAVDVEWDRPDDLPDTFEGGYPKAVAAP